MRKQLATSDGQAAYTLRARHLARDLQLERKDEDLQAARAANRELMTQLNVSLPAQRR